MNSDAPTPPRATRPRSTTGRRSRTICSRGSSTRSTIAWRRSSAFVELARLGDEKVDPLAELPDRDRAAPGAERAVRAAPRAASGSRGARAVAPCSTTRSACTSIIRGCARERCEVRYEGTPVPVRAPRWALVRTLVMLVHAAKRAGRRRRERGEAPIVVRADDIDGERARERQPRTHRAISWPPPSAPAARSRARATTLVLPLPSLRGASTPRAGGARRRRAERVASRYADARIGASSERRRPSAFERICETRDSLMPSTSAMSADLSSSK